jgi:hypothetical protein
MQPTDGPCLGEAAVEGLAQLLLLPPPPPRLCTASASPLYENLLVVFSCLHPLPRSHQGLVVLHVVSVCRIACLAYVHCDLCCFVAACARLTQQNHGDTAAGA